VPIRVSDNCDKPAHSMQRGVSIDSDEPVAVRCKQTFDRLKRKAEREGERVSVSDGTLCIDDTIDFRGALGLHHMVGEVNKISLEIRQV
jgi:hypothetical protein